MESFLRRRGWKLKRAVEKFLTKTPPSQIVKAAITKVEKFLTKTPLTQIVKAAITKVWRPKSLNAVTNLVNGLYLFRFTS